MKAAKPFARSRDDKDLDEMYRTRARFGDPMAQFTKKRQLTDEELAPPVITDSMRQYMNKSGRSTGHWELVWFLCSLRQ